MMSLNLLDNLTNKTINSSLFLLALTQYTDKRGEHFVTSELIKAYANCDQNADRTIKSIDKMNTLRELSDNANQDYYDNLQKKGYNSYYNSLEDMMFNVADKDKEGAKKVATHILKTVKAPKNKDGTEAYLNLLKNAAIQNPDCAE